MISSFYSENELKKIGFKFLGDNVLVSQKASIYGADRMIIGNNVRIDDFCILSGSIELGNYTHIGAYSALFGGNKGIQMMDFSGLSSKCVIYAETDDYTGSTLTNPTIPDKYRNVSGGKVILEKHVIIGTGTSIMPGVVLGEGAAVGSMSLVNHSVAGWGIYAGCPCRKIKERSKQLLEIEKEFRSM